MARRRARRWQVSAVVLTLFATMFLAACDLYDLPLPGSPVDKDHAYQVTADFEDVMNVVPKSPVMVDDVTVGEVLEVERDGWRAKVTMHLRDDVVLPANAVAEIRQTSLLGRSTSLSRRRWTVDGVSSPTGPTSTRRRPRATPRSRRCSMRCRSFSAVVGWLNSATSPTSSTSS